MNGDFAHGTITFTADLPQEAIDKVLANTKEDMVKWLESGNTFDLSDGADRTVAYISFSKGTKPEDIVRVVRCRDCKHHEVCKNGVNGWCNEHERPTDVTYFCADGERKECERGED